MPLRKLLSPVERKFMEIDKMGDQTERGRGEAMSFLCVLRQELIWCREISWTRNPDNFSMSLIELVNRADRVWLQVAGRYPFVWCNGCSKH